MNSKQYYIYIVSNKTRTVLYTGVTSNLRHIYEYKNKLMDGFTKKDNCTDLLFFEVSDQIAFAIDREKEIKGWKRVRNDDPIKVENPLLKDLAIDWF